MENIIIWVVTPFVTLLLTDTEPAARNIPLTSELKIDSSRCADYYNNQIRHTGVQQHCSVVG